MSAISDEIISPDVQVKQVIPLPGCTLRQTDKRTLKTRHRFSLISAGGTPIDIATDHPVLGNHMGAGFECLG